MTLAKTMAAPSIGAERDLDLGIITRTDIVRFAGAGGDFNPVHHDEVAAKEAGFPSVFAMGLMTASMASRLTTDWFGLSPVRSFEVRFRAMVWPGEHLGVHGKVIDCQTEDEGERLVVEFNVTNADGEVKLSGTSNIFYKNET